jgi:hypothetical protein
MCICFSNVYYICLIVLVGSVVIWDFFYCYGGTTDTVVPDYGGVSLAGVYTFNALFWASRAFSSWTYLAKISSALSISWSSSTGSTVIVTDLFKTGLVPAFSCVNVLPAKWGLLDDGLSSSSTCYLLVVLPISLFVRSITLLVISAGSI